MPCPLEIILCILWWLLSFSRTIFFPSQTLWQVQIVYILWDTCSDFWWLVDGWLSGHKWLVAVRVQKISTLTATFLMSYHLSVYCTISNCLSVMCHRACGCGCGWNQGVTEDVRSVYKYKPVALKTWPVVQGLPAEFRIKREIIDDPLAKMPKLSPNPPDFILTGRYT